jgi:hypothetical protein
MFLKKGSCNWRRSLFLFQALRLILKAVEHGVEVEPCIYRLFLTRQRNRAHPEMTKAIMSACMGLVAFRLGLDFVHKPCQTIV